jgi:hypothetical protein
LRWSGDIGGPSDADRVERAVLTSRYVSGRQFVAVVILYTATALFVANFLLGALVQLGVVDTKPFRWLHPALFFAVFASAAVAVGVGFLSKEPYRWAMLPVLGLFAVLPRVRAGTVGHAGLASCALIFYSIAFVSVL